MLKTFMIGLCLALFSTVALAAETLKVGMSADYPPLHFKEDGKVIHFKNPKVQAAIAANTYIISGPSDTKPLQELLPQIVSQLGMDNLAQLQGMGGMAGAGAGMPGMAGASIPEGDDDDDDDDVPDLVEGNFEEQSEK